MAASSCIRFWHLERQTMARKKKKGHDVSVASFAEGYVKTALKKLTNTSTIISGSSFDGPEAGRTT